MHIYIQFTQQYKMNQMQTCCLNGFNLIRIGWLASWRCVVDERDNFQPIKCRVLGLQKREVIALDAQTTNMKWHEEEIRKLFHTEHGDR